MLKITIEDKKTGDIKEIECDFIVSEYAMYDEESGDVLGSSFIKGVGNKEIMRKMLYALAGSVEEVEEE